MSKRAFLDDELWFPDAHSHLCYLAHLGDEFGCCLGVLSRFVGPSLYLLRITFEAGGAIQYYSCESDVADAMVCAVTEIGAIDHTAVPAEFALVLPALSRKNDDTITDGPRMAQIPSGGPEIYERARSLGLERALYGPRIIVSR
ncbi:hypothetical protein AZE42_12261 [Rhizopogon vesiculosus]|uniref:Uncharacterized protein n=1 Tax=Rhizopogon vesiculosus TaxID=180088 RepID=A0A1J8QHJ0_9AGAM|nr:hypothetical protein AZE42_12261 [Rhizopogon vesiculosus]